MKKNITGFFEEAPGVKSSTRLFSFLVMLFLFAFNILLSISEGFSIDYNFILFNFIILIAIFTPKYLHKLAERKAGHSKSDDEKIKVA